MPPLIVPQAGQLRLLWAQGGVLTAVNVMGVLNPGGIAITQALTNTVGAAVKSAIGTSAINAALGTAVTLVNVGLRDLRSANQPEFLDSGGPVAGTAAGDLLPPQTALCITLRTALAGKRFRGRYFQWGYTEAVNSAGGALVGAASTVAFVTAIKAALVSSSLDLAVLSRPNPAANPPNPGNITAVTTIVARDLVWDTQRRRAQPGV